MSLTIQQHVFRLQVTVNNTLAVQVLKRQQYLSSIESGQHLIELLHLPE